MTITIGVHRFLRRFINRFTHRYDMVCDGHEDEEEINTAIRNIRFQHGGMVKLSKGKFHITKPLEKHTRSVYKAELMGGSNI